MQNSALVMLPSLPPRDWNVSVMNVDGVLTKHRVLSASAHNKTM
jgi:hypothetical protein